MIAVPVISDKPHFADILKSSELFKQCSRVGIDELFEKSIKLNLTSGAGLFEEKMRPSGLYIVTSGLLQMYKSLGNGKELLIKIAKPGEVIGLPCMLLDKHYPYSIRSVSNATIFIIPKSTAEKFIAMYPSITEGMLKILSKDLLSAWSEIINSQTKSVLEKLASTLLILSELEPLNGSNGKLQVDRKDLVKIVGSSRETISRMLTELERKEVISKDNNGVTILDNDKLRNLAGRDL